MDHIAIPVHDLERTRAFYAAALEPLGWRCSGYREGVFAAFKREGAPALYFNRANRGRAAAVAPVHLAFKAPDASAVQRFHSAALLAGGQDHGGPGPRPAYGAAYYAAFVLDPDGHNVEAVMGGVG